MRRTGLFILILVLLSALSGFLLSKASLTGKVGISLFYQEYGFLKIWWQGALVIFSVLMVLLLLQAMAEKKLATQKAFLLHIIMILLAIGGFYFTWYDFRHTATHRLLGARFHTGAYLFWLGWILISVFYLTKKKIQPAAP